MSISFSARRSLPGMLVLCLMMAGCEVPSRPDFSIEHNMQIPLLTKQLAFLGGADALVDTAKAGLLNDLDIRHNGAVRLTVLTGYSGSIHLKGLPKLPPGVNYPINIMVNLGRDDPANGTDTLDLFDDLEAQINKITSLDYFSQRVGSFSLPGAELNLFYRTNLGEGNRVFAGLVGSDSRGNDSYLSSVPGSPYASDTSGIEGLWAHGHPLAGDQILTFPIRKEKMIDDTLEGVVSFNRENSNLGDFVGNLPTEIRFIGKASITNPRTTDDGSDIYFKTAIGLDIPLEIATPGRPVTYVDTISVDFSGLPSEEDNTTIDKGELKIYYVNKLPLAAEVHFRLLDGMQHPLAAIIPDTAAGSPKVVLNPAQVDPATLFSAEPAKGITQIQLSHDQINALSQTRFMIINASLQTKDEGSVRLRASDYIRMTISGNFTIVSKVNQEGN